MDLALNNQQRLICLKIQTTTSILTWRSYTSKLVLNYSLKNIEKCPIAATVKYLFLLPSLFYNQVIELFEWDIVIIFFFFKGFTF